MVRYKEEIDDVNGLLDIYNDEEVGIQESQAVMTMYVSYQFVLDLD